MTDENEPVVIRPAKRQDMSAVATMAAEFHAFLASMDDSDPTFDIEGTASKLDQFGFGSTPLFSSLIAEKDDNPIGYTIYNMGVWADSFEGIIFLSDLYVRQAWRGQGVGQQLMHHLAAVGKAQGCEKVMWTVWTRNEYAKRFYEKLGAVPIEDEVLMEWPT